MMQTTLLPLDISMAGHGFTMRSRTSVETTWHRETGSITRQELTIQENSLLPETFLGVLRISIRSRLWDRIELRREDSDEFFEALTVEWGANGIFPYGTQRWKPWPASESDRLRRDMEVHALPWFERHGDARSLAMALERQVKEGIPLNQTGKALPRKLIARLFGRSEVAAQRAFVPRGHKQRLAQIYFELGEFGAALDWGRQWLADMKGWSEASKYEDQLEQLAKRRES